MVRRRTGAGTGMALFALRATEEVSGDASSGIAEGELDARRWSRVAKAIITPTDRSFRSDGRIGNRYQEALRELDRS